MSWHDVAVHGFRLDNFREEQGTSDLVLDIDYILKWHDTDSGFEFTISQATLKFHDVFGLKIDLDYAATSAGMSPFSIHVIDREPLNSPFGSQSFRWSIKINWPPGLMEFDSPGFTQSLTGVPVRKRGQWLESGERTGGSP